MKAMRLAAVFSGFVGVHCVQLENIIANQSHGIVLQCWTCEC